MLEAIVGVALRAILASVLLGGVLAALVFAATRVLALTAATRHALWTTALICTALMPVAGIGVSMWKAVPSAAVGDGGSQGVVRAGAGDWVVPGVAAAGGGASAAASRPAGTRAAMGGTRLDFMPRVSRDLAVAVVAIWGIGALAGLIGLGASIVRVRGLKRRSSPLDGDLADELPWLTEVGPGREIYLRLSYETETPVAIGFRRPVILIPTELATADGLAAIEQLILHEHAHLRRRDDWTNLIQRTIERIFWFNPIVWLVGRRIALEREIASDDAVVEKTGEAHAYATSLWKLAREMRMPEHAVVAPGALLTRKQIAVRIERLLDKNRSRLHRSPSTALGVALAGLLAVAFVAASAPAVELPAAAEPIAVATPAAVTAWHADVAKPNVVKPHPAPAPHAAKPAVAAAAPVTKTVRIVRIVHDVKLPAAAPAPSAPARPAIPPLVTAPHEIAVGPVAVPSISPEDLAAMRAAASAQVAAERARHGHDLAYIGPEVARALHDALATLPSTVAHEAGSNPQRAHDGMKLSRELIASCTACSFRNADVRGLDLHGLRITAGSFAGADMRGVNLSGAKLVGASLRGANLANADLRNAQLSGVEVAGANFEGAQLDGMKLVGVSLRGVNLRGTTLRSVISSCTGCDLHGLDLHGQDLHGITLTGADLSHADLHDANLSGVRFTGVDLSNANLGGVDLTNAQLSGCDLAGTEMRGARTTGMIVHASALEG